MVSKLIQQLAPSATLALSSKVKELQSKGLDIVDFTVGEPDSNTPQNIQNAAIAAMRGGFTKYAPAAGIADLREAIAKKLKKDNNIDYSPSQVIIGVGTKQLLYSAFQAICNVGDEVIIATPTWTTYIEQVKLAGATPVLCPLKAPFRLKASDIAACITSRTKAILINSPGNPTGAMIENSELANIAELATQHDIYVVSDEIYEKIAYAHPHTSIASFGEEIKKRTLTVNGFSKAYAMTGWRIGYAAGPQDIIGGMIALAGQTTSGTSSISQKAGVEALLGDQTAISTMRVGFEKRRQIAYLLLTEIPGIEVALPDGAFYIFPCIKKLLKNGQTSTDWASDLLEKTHVAVIPGEAFEAPGYIRISYAISIESLKKGLTLIKEFVNKI